VVVAISIFAVRNGTEERVRAAFERRPRLVESAPGFLGLEVFQSGPSFLLFTRWEDEACFRAWHHSPAHHRSHAMMPPGLKLDPSKTRLFVGERIDRATSDALERFARAAVSV
jgi:heme-degrading monooxygenase HmoA